MIPHPGTSIALCCFIIGFVSFLEAESFGLPALNVFKSQSLEEVARKRIADLHGMRNQLQKNRDQNKWKVGTSSYPVNFAAKTSKQPEANNLSGLGFNMMSLDVLMKPMENRMASFTNTWSSLRSIFAMKATRDGFLSSVLPNSRVLLRMVKMRNEMEPSLREYLTGKYNNFLTALLPYSEKIGVPAFVLNAMKISADQEFQWQVIEKLLETTSVEELIRNIPDFSSMRPSGMVSNSLNDPIQSRVDEELVSDQEPDATIKGLKKKYSSFGIRMGNRRNRPNKGDLAIAATSTAIVGPDRTGYEYSSYADQYGPYGQDSYDIYGKASEELASSSNDKAYTSSQGSNHKSYDDYSYRNLKGSGSGKTPQASPSHGYNTFYSSKVHSHSGGDGYGFSGGSGSGWGWGGGGGMMRGLLDPFSILGTLSFLTFLGLLFQQSLNRNNMVMTNTTTNGRREDARNFFTSSSGLKFQRRPGEINKFNSAIQDLTFTTKEKNRRSRGLEENYNESEVMAGNILQGTWKDISTITKIKDKNSRQRRLCLLFRDIKDKGIFSLFKDELEKEKEDKEFLRSLIPHSEGIAIACS